MKKFLITKIALSCLIPIVLLSCDDKNDPSIDSDTKFKKISIEILSEPANLDKPSPRMVATVDDWKIIEYTSEGLDYEDMTTINFINKKERISMVVSGYKNAAIFYELNPFTGEKSDTVIISAEKQGYVCIALCKMNWTKMAYSIISETVHGINSSPKSNGKYNTRRRATDDYSDIRASFSTLLDKISDDISNYTQLPGMFSKSVGAVAAVWTKVAIPWAKYQLYDEYPEVQDKILFDYTLDDLFERIKCEIVPHKDELDLLNSTIYIYNDLRDRFGDSSSTPLTDDDISDISYRFSSTSNATQKAQTTYGQEPIKYRVYASVLSVTETTATLHASFECLDGQQSYISKFGVELYGTDGTHKNIELSNFNNNIVLSGLTPGNNYIANVYLYSFGKKYETTVTFSTSFQFTLHPEVITFEQKGGSRAVALMVAKESLKSWDIKSKPQWCNIQKGDLSFFVDVDETKQARNGEIIVKASLHDGTTHEASVKVEQLANSWDGTKWNCQGSVNTSGDIPYYDNFSIADVTNFGIEIINVEKNEFILTGDMAGLESKSRISCDANNNLILKYTENISESGMSVNISTVITFTRKTTTTLSAILTGSMNMYLPNYGNMNMSMNGTFAGTLIE